MKMQTMKTINGKTYVRCYGPNSYRYEREWDGEKAYYHIYINNEEVEWCPLMATEEEVKARYLELCEEHGIEDTEMYVRKELKDI